MPVTYGDIVRADLMALDRPKNQTKKDKVMNNKEELTQWLKDNYNEVDLLSDIDEKMEDYVDEDDIEEHGSKYDAYLEVGRGGAHSDVVNDVYRDAQEHYVGEELAWDTFEEAFIEAFEDGDSMITGME